MWLVDTERMKRAILVSGLILSAVAVLAWGPRTYVAMAGRPLWVDCGGLDPNICDTAWRAVARKLDVAEPIVWVTVRPADPEGLCADMRFASGWLAPTAVWSPLCATGP